MGRDEPASLTRTARRADPSPQRRRGERFGETTTGGMARKNRSTIVDLTPKD
jgi:hypothetical protein